MKLRVIFTLVVLTFLFFVVLYICNYLATDKEYQKRVRIRDFEKKHSTKKTPKRAPRIIASELSLSSLPSELTFKEKIAKLFPLLINFLENNPPAYRFGKFKHLEWWFNNKSLKKFIDEVRDNLGENGLNDLIGFYKNSKDERNRISLLVIISMLKLEDTDSFWKEVLLKGESIEEVIIALYSMGLLKTDEAFKTLNEYLSSINTPEVRNKMGGMGDYIYQALLESISMFGKKGLPILIGYFKNNPLYADDSKFEIGNLKKDNYALMEMMFVESLIISRKDFVDDLKSMLADEKNRFLRAILLEAIFNVERDYEWLHQFSKNDKDMGYFIWGSLIFPSLLKHWRGDGKYLNERDFKYIKMIVSENIELIIEPEGKFFYDLFLSDSVDEFKKKVNDSLNYELYKNYGFLSKAEEDRIKSRLLGFKMKLSSNEDELIDTII